MTLEPKAVSESTVTFVRTMTQMDANLAGNVHGGVIMKEVDSAAGTAAIRHAGRPCVTAAIDELSFLEPVYVGDILTVTATVNDVELVEPADAVDDGGRGQGRGGVLHGRREASHHERVSRDGCAGRIGSTDRNPALADIDTG